MADRRSAARRRFDKERENTIATAVKLEAASKGAGEAFLESTADALVAARLGLADRLRRNGVEFRSGGVR